MSSSPPPQYAGRTIRAVFLLTLLFCGSIAHADQDLVGPRANGMGGALRALPSGVSAPLLNPAAMSLMPLYTFGANYQYRTNDNGHLVNVGVVDSSTARFGAGLNYSFVTNDLDRVYMLENGAFPIDEGTTTHQVTVAGSYAFGDFFNVGVTGKYINASNDLPADDTPPAIRRLDVSNFTMDAGGILRIGSVLNLAVVGYNLIGVDDFYFPRTMAVGAALNFKQTFLIEYDTVLDFTSDPNKTSLNFQGGVEYITNNFIAIRAGAMHDGVRETTSASGGISLVSPRASFIFGYRQVFSGGNQSLFGGTVEIYLM